MIELSLLFLAAGAVVLALHYFHGKIAKDVTTPKTSLKINKLWEYVEQSLKAQRFRQAERGLLRILREDTKNTAAYNRLGMLYAKEKRFDDAIECFDIASSLAPSIASLYNLGLVHYEKGNYQQAALTFEKVVDLEPNVKYFLAFAKAHQALENYKKVIDILKKVVEVDSDPRYREFLAESYDKADQPEKAEEIRQELKTAKDQTKHRPFSSKQVASYKA